MATLTPDEYLFRQERQRALVDSDELVGLDHVEVDERGDGLWVLTLNLVPQPVEQAPVVSLSKDNVRITLAGRPCEVRVVEVGETELVGSPHSGELPARRVEVMIRRGVPSGAASGTEDAIYTVDIVDKPEFDSWFRRASFRFSPGVHPQALARDRPPRPRPRAPAELDYLSRDYESFRQLMLDQMSHDVPGWTERSPADLGIAVIETLAYAADYLSYYQDAVATEAYLRTARLRTSVRRHARLLDYSALHERIAARLWAAFDVDGGHEGFELRKGTRLAPRSEALSTTLTDEQVEQFYQRSELVFETLNDAILLPSRNRLRFYAWKAREYVLPSGATRAALVGRPKLDKGDLLLFREVLGRKTGRPEDADRGRCHCIRLTRATPTWDPVSRLPEAVTEIEWAPVDALPFDLVVCARIGTQAIDGITEVCGNVVLAEHGRRVEEELPAMPRGERFRPKLSFAPVCFSEWEDDLLQRSALEAMEQYRKDALPQIELWEYPRGAFVPAVVRRRGLGRRWLPVHDLVGSGRYDRHFVVEVESDGSSRLRFGDGVLGRRPPEDSVFLATYRVGGGAVGNIGPENLAHVRGPIAGLTREEAARYDEALRGRVRQVTNPLPAEGGREAEPQERARLFASQAFRRPVRCVTREDYQSVLRVRRGRTVRRATTREVWTGSERTVEVFVQRPRDEPVDQGFCTSLEEFLAPFVPMGTSLRVLGAHRVPIHVRLSVRPASDHTFRQVLNRLAGVFSPADFFNPERFGFGESLYRSQVLAAAYVEEIETVEVLAFHRWGLPSADSLERGRIEIGETEIISCQNDSAAPHLGIVVVEDARRGVSA